MIQIFAGTYSGQLIIIEGNRQALRLKTIKQILQNSVRSVLSTSNELFVGGYDQQIKGVDKRTGQQKRQSKDSNGIVHCMKQLNSTQVAIGLQNGVLRIWNKINWSPVKQIKQHKKTIKGMAIDKAGVVLITIGGKEMIFWKISTMKSFYHYRFDEQWQHVLIDKDFENVFLFSDKSMHQYSSDNNEQVNHLDLTSKIICTTIYEDFILIGTENGDVLIWKINNYDFKIVFKAHETRVKCMKIVESSDMDFLITASTNGQICVWDIIEFLKSVDNISQDYDLEGLEPLSSVNTNQRIISLDASFEEFKQEQKKKEQPKVLKKKELTKVKKEKINIKPVKIKQNQEVKKTPKMKKKIRKIQQ